MTGAESLFIYGATGFVVSFVVLTLILRVWRRKLTRRVAEFHHAQNASQAPVPRYGGLGLAAAFVALVGLRRFFNHGFQTDASAWVIAGTALAMFGLGFWDDVPAAGRQAQNAGRTGGGFQRRLLSGGGDSRFQDSVPERMIDLGIYGWPVTVFWLVAMTNLVNLIDGVDGLAGGIALMMMVLLSVVGDSLGFGVPGGGRHGGSAAGVFAFQFPAREDLPWGRRGLFPGLSHRRAGDLQLAKGHRGGRVDRAAVCTGAADPGHHAGPDPPRAERSAVVPARTSGICITGCCKAGCRGRT